MKISDFANEYKKPEYFPGDDPIEDMNREFCYDINEYLEQWVEVVP